MCSLQKNIRSLIVFSTVKKEKYIGNFISNRGYNLLKSSRKKNNNNNKKQ